MPAILNYLDQIAVFSGGIFVGTAVYTSVSEVPALRAFGLDEHWRFFPFMYERAAVLQVASSMLAASAAIVHGSRIVGSSFDRNLWLAAGLTLAGMLPFTFVCIMPTNKRIIDDNKRVKLGQASLVDTATKKEILDKWAGLHLVRSIASTAAFGAMIFGLSRHSSLIYAW